MATARLLFGIGVFPYRTAGNMIVVAMVWWIASANVWGQVPTRHWLHSPALPPGAIGSQQLLASGPLFGYFQVVKVQAPQGAQISVVDGEAFSPPQPNNMLVGLQLGRVYRFKLTNILQAPGVELFPTVELVDRTHPPAGKELEFPIPLEFTEEDLRLAIRGKLVTRIVYVEDPKLAIPVASRRDDQAWFDAPPGDDPLLVADRLGRPVAFVRVGGRLPSPHEVDSQFFFNSPPLIQYDEPVETQTAPELPAIETASLSATPAVTKHQPLVPTAFETKPSPPRPANKAVRKTPRVLR